MGAGCLGPKKRIGEIYIQIINTIHQEAKRINAAEQQFMQFRNLDIYSLLQQKIHKKGHLRKLMDNLTSHRNKIADSITHNYRIVIQSRTLENHYAGLIIADSILGGVFNQSNFIQNQNGFSIQQSLSKYSEQIHKQKQNISQHFIKHVDIRCQLSYLRMILYLLQHEHRIYLHILESLEKYCKDCATKISSADEAFQILKKISMYIEKKVSVQKSTQTYFILLSNLKDFTKNQFKDQKQVQRFINIWLLQAQDNRVFKDNVFKIISIYFQKSISLWDYDFVYHILIGIYDERMFRQNEICQLENALIQMIKDQDLYQQFLKGLFLYLLAYISYSNDDNLSSRWNTIGWGLSIQMKSMYPHITLQQSKINSLKSLRRLIVDKYVDLNETVTYNRCSFVYAFTFNIFYFINQKRVHEVMVEQFFKIIPYLNKASIYLILQILFQQLKWDYATEQYQAIILQMVRKLFGIQAIFLQVNYDFNYFIPVSLHLPRSIKLQIIQLTGFIIKNLSHKVLNEKLQQICQYLHAIYENIYIPLDTILFKHQLCCSTLSFLKTLQQRGLSFIILAYCEKIALTHTQVNYNYVEFFILLYLYEMRELICPSLKVPEEMKQIKYKITPSANNQYLKERINQHLNIIGNTQFTKQIQEMKHKLIANQQQYSIFTIVFDKIFKRQGMQQGEEGSNIQAYRSTIGRKSSVISDNNELDQSFNQILDIIKI